jgi:hypothetical protein
VIQFAVATSRQQVDFFLSLDGKLIFVYISPKRQQVDPLRLTEKDPRASCANYHDEHSLRDDHDEDSFRDDNDDDDDDA